MLAWLGPGRVEVDDGEGRRWEGLDGGLEGRLVGDFAYGGHGGCGGQWMGSRMAKEEAVCG